MEPTQVVQVVQIIPLIVQNPSLIGFILFVICFFPLLAYVLRWAEKQSERHQEFTSRAMDENKVREERMAVILNEALPKQTEVLNNINTSMIQMKDAVCDMKNRVEDIEYHLGFEKEEKKIG